MDFIIKNKYNFLLVIILIYIPIVKKKKKNLIFPIEMQIRSKSREYSMDDRWNKGLLDAFQNNKIKVISPISKTKMHI